MIMMPYSIRAAKGKCESRMLIANRLPDVLTLVEKGSHILIASVDRDGLAHMASVRDLRLSSEQRIVLTEWFCSTTMANLAQNPHLAVLIWHEKSDIGYQLVGELVQISNLSVMNGFSSDVSDYAGPRVKRELELEIEQVLDYSHGIHQDLP